MHETQTQTVVIENQNEINLSIYSSHTICSSYCETVGPLGRAWGPGYSPDTSVLSALETL